MTTCGRLLQRLYGWSVPLFMVSHRGESGARDMRPPVTNLQRRARDAFQLAFAPEGAAKPVNEYSGKAAPPALRIAFAESWLRISRPPTVREVKTCTRVKRTPTLPSLASTGLTRSTMFARK